jgi:hypothetical protein
MQPIDNGTKKFETTSQTPKQPPEVPQPIFPVPVPTPPTTPKSLKTRSIIHPFTKIPNLLASALRSIFRWLGKKISALFHKIFPTSSPDKYHLLRGEGRISAPEYEWHINSALLKEAETQCTDPVLKKKIQFMRANYLAKAAPNPSNLMQFLHTKFGNMVQTSPFIPWQYYRGSFREHLNFANPLNKNLGLGTKSPLILTDTTDIDPILSLKYSVIQSDTPHIEKTIEDVLEKHFIENPSSKALQKQLHPPLIIDMTSALKAYIHTAKSKDKKKQFEQVFEQEKRKLEVSIESSIHNLLQKHPDLKKIHQRRLLDFIHKNVMPICKVDFFEEDGSKTEGLSGIKILPSFSNTVTTSSLETTYSHFMEFVEITGLYIGALNFRRHVLPLLNPGETVEYAIPATHKGEIYFETKTSLLQRNLFQSFAQRMKSDELKNRPDIRVLGESVVRLVSGLLSNEISDASWTKLNENLTTRQLVQTSLFKIANLLATANLHCFDFQKFSQQIELIHCEIAELLELFSPFQQGDFQKIYATVLHDIVPEGLCLTTGLAKTAMTTFAGINAAVAKTTTNPITALAHGSYYEFSELLGYENSVENIIDDPKISKVDLYVGQINPNVDIEDECMHYEPRNIAQDIEKIFAKKPHTDHLTVAIDCTIDYIQSQDNKKLLERFKKEIQSGKLNFVFFKSGLKLDQFGMDSYYGAPLYIVNNGNARWAPFNNLTQQKVYETDNLSHQWFCLAHRYTPDLLDDYRRILFENSRTLLDQVPESLKPEAQGIIRVNTADTKMKASFIDIKVVNPHHKLTSYALVGWLSLFLLRKNINLYYRSSFGFFHPNVNVIAAHTSKTSTTIRINPGLDPQQNAAIIEVLQKLAKKKGIHHQKHTRRQKVDMMLSK